MYIYDISRLRVNNKGYINYQQCQLHVSASILAIVRFYSTYQVTIQYVCGVLYLISRIQHDDGQYRGRNM